MVPVSSVRYLASDFQTNLVAASDCVEEIGLEVQGYTVPFHGLDRMSLAACQSFTVA